MQVVRTCHWCTVLTTQDLETHTTKPWVWWPWKMSLRRSFSQRLWTKQTLSVSIMGARHTSLVHVHTDTYGVTCQVDLCGCLAMGSELRWCKFHSWPCCVLGDINMLLGDMAEIPVSASRSTGILSVRSAWMHTSGWGLSSSFRNKQPYSNNK